jgi:hypothetical protein
LFRPEIFRGCGKQNAQILLLKDEQLHVAVGRLCWLRDAFMIPCKGLEMKSVSSHLAVREQAPAKADNQGKGPDGAQGLQSPQMTQRVSDPCSQFPGGQVGGTPKDCSSPRYRSDNVASPLMQKAREGNREELQKLLREGANPALQDEHGNTALFYAAQEGEAAAVRVLAEHDGTLLSRRNKRGETAATVAARSGKEHALMTLIDKGANLYEISDHKNLLEHAVLSGDTATVRSLVRELKHRNQSYVYPESAKSVYWQEMIFNASMLSIENKDSCDMSRVLIEGGVGDIGFSRQQGLLEFAIKMGNDEVVGILVKQFPILRHLKSERQ